MNWKLKFKNLAMQKARPDPLTISFNPAFGGHMIVGFQRFFSKRLALDGSVKFTWASASTTGTAQAFTLTTSDANMRNITTNVGVAYYF